MDGAALRAALENGVSQIGSTGGRFPRVSGMTIAVDPSAPAGSRITDVTIAGQPLDPSRAYTVATNDFMAGGGDGYDTFRAAEVVVSSQAGPLLANLLIEQIQARGSIGPTIEGRIRVLSGTVAE